MLNCSQSDEQKKLLSDILIDMLDRWYTVELWKVKTPTEAKEKLRKILGRATFAL